MQPPNNTDTEYITLGKIVGFFGVKGWVKVHSDTNPRENIVSYPHWWLRDKSGWRKVNVVKGQRSGKNIIAQIQGVDTRELAEPLLGLDVAVSRDALPALKEGFYWTDLVGLDVIDLGGNLLGPVKRLFETGANDVLVVRDTRSSDAEDILIPWVRPSVITKVDLDAGQIWVDWDPDY